jgi:hypothetical protein
VALRSRGQTSQIADFDATAAAGGDDTLSLQRSELPADGFKPKTQAFGYLRARQRQRKL